jgi:hypothetical protein
MAEISGGTLNVGALQPDLVLRMQANPAEVASKYQTLQGQLLQNRLLGQQISGKEELGRIIGQHTGPDGQTDWNAVSASASKKPNASILLPEIQKSAGERQLQQIEIAKQQMGLSEGQWAWTGNTLLPLVGRNDLTAEQVRDHIVRNLQGSPMAGDPQFVARVGQFVQGLAGADPATIAERVKGLALMSTPTSERAALLLGSLDKTAIGPETVITQTSPLGGETQVRARMDMGLSPESRVSEGTRVQNPDGTTTIFTKGALADAERTGAAPKGIQSGSPYGTQEAATSAAQKGVEMAQEWAAGADAAPETKAQIRNLRDQVGRFTSGPQASWVYRMKALATMLGVAPKDVKDEVAAQEEFNKLAQQFINANTRQLGEGTDSKLSATVKAAPNELMSKEGVLGVLALMEGQQDAILAKNAAWQKWLAAGKSPGTATQFMTEWNKLYNPRVFQAQYMDPKQFDVMMRGMTPKDREQFIKDQREAIKFGWVKARG